MGAYIYTSHPSGHGVWGLPHQVRSKGMGGGEFFSPYIPPNITLDLTVTVTNSVTRHAVTTVTSDCNTLSQ